MNAPSGTVTAQRSHFGSRMKSTRWCAVAFFLWVLTLGVLGWLFYGGMTTAGTDGRTAILLAPGERDQILSEMRALLKAVDAVVRTYGEERPDVKQAEAAVRAVGMQQAADVNPVIMAKLPLPFKQMGMSVHRDMDALADAMVAGETPPQIMSRLAGLTARCTTCHDLYRFAAEK